MIKYHDPGVDDSTPLGLSSRDRETTKRKRVNLKIETIACHFVLLFLRAISPA